MFLALVLKEENPFPRVSHLLFFEQPRVTIFGIFFFEFVDILKNQPARGSLVVGISVLRALHHIFCFVSITLLGLLISFLIIVEINMIFTYLSDVMSN